MVMFHNMKISNFKTYFLLYKKFPLLWKQYPEKGGTMRNTVLRHHATKGPSLLYVVVVQKDDHEDASGWKNTEYVHFTGYNATLTLKYYTAI